MVFKLGILDYYKFHLDCNVGNASAYSSVHDEQFFQWKFIRFVIFIALKGITMYVQNAVFICFQPLTQVLYIRLILNFITSFRQIIYRSCLILRFQTFVVSSNAL